MNLPALLVPVLDPEPTEEPTPEPTTPEPTTPEASPSSTPPPDTPGGDESTSDDSPTSDEPPAPLSVPYEPTTSVCGTMETSQDYCLHLTPDTVTFFGSGLLLVVLLLSALLASQLRRP